MITCSGWVKRGVAKAVPDKVGITIIKKWAYQLG